jgi:two-component system, cell cycle sensor histidine kinase and response regulator CckA
MCLRVLSHKIHWGVFPAPELVVLLSSGYSISGNASAIIDRGCVGFVQKPFNLAQLSEKVAAVLSI